MTRYDKFIKPFRYKEYSRGKGIQRMRYARIKDINIRYIL